DERVRVSVTDVPPAANAAEVDDLHLGVINHRVAAADPRTQADVLSAEGVALVPGTALGEHLPRHEQVRPQEDHHRPGALAACAGPVAAVGGAQQSGAAQQ